MMSHIHQIKIRIGDIVELSPSKLSTLDDLDLEKCTVLELDEADGRIKVVFNNNNAHNESFFDRKSTVDWFSISHVIDIERDYKVIEITDTEDDVHQQPVAIVSMAPVIKKINQDSEGYQVSGTVSLKDTDTFIFAGLTYHDLKDYKGTINRISFARFRMEELWINNSWTQVYRPVFKIVDVEDIFVLP